LSGAKDGKWLYFTSDRGFADSPRTRAITTAELSRQLRSAGNGLGDIYRVEAKAALERFGVKPN
jgi:hypothetical protein